jgi:AraC-like DNA-binding protein
MIASQVESERKNLERSSHSVELIMREARDLAHLIATNPNAQRLLYFSSIDQKDEDAGILSIRNLQTLASGVHSIYLYNHGRREIFYTGRNLRVATVWQMDAFFDSDLLQSSLQENRVNLRAPQRRDLSEMNTLNGKTEVVDVYSFVFSFSHSQNYETSSLVVINVSTQSLADTLLQLDSLPEYPLELVDADGRRVLPGSGVPIASARIDLTENERSFTQEITSGVDGLQYVVVGGEPPALEGWRILKFISLEKLLAKPRLLRRKMVLVTLAVTIGMVAIAFFSTRRFGRSLDVQVRLAEQWGRMDENDRRSLIDARLRTLFDFYGEIQPEEAMRMLESAGFNLEIDRPLVIRFLVAESLGDTIVRDAVQHHIEANVTDGSIATYGQSNDCIALIAQDGWTVDRLATLTESLVDSIANTVESPCHVIEVMHPQSLSKMVDCVREIDELTPYLRCFQMAPVVTITHLRDRHDSHGTYPSDLERDLVKAILDEGKSDIERTFQSFQAAITGSNIGFYRRSINRLIRTVYEQIRRVNPIINRRVPVGDLEALLERVDRMQTAKAQEEYLADYFTKANEAIADTSDEPAFSSLSSKSIAFVVRNYANPGLGSQMIADALSMNPTYLLRVFRKETNVSLHEYINDYRVKIAAELLESTSLPIREIRIRTGFTNDQNFFRVFKRTYNVTPAAHRQQTSQTRQ